MRALGVGVAMLLVTVISVPLLLAGGGGSPAAAAAAPSGSGSTTTTRLTALFPDVPEGGGPGHERFAPGNCTWWAAYNRHVTGNGNGSEWLLNAAAQGYATSSTP